MKASGEGAGTIAGQGIEKSPADDAQEVPRDGKKSINLTCFNSSPSRPSVRNKGSMDTCKCNSARDSSERGLGSENLICFYFSYTAHFIKALRSIFDVSKPSRCLVKDLEL